MTVFIQGIDGSHFLLAAWTISLIACHFFPLAMRAVLFWRKADRQIPRDVLKTLVRIGYSGNCCQGP